MYENFKDAEKEKIEERPAISFVSDTSCHDSSKDKSKLIEVMCRYYHTTKDIKANNYQVNVRKLDHGTPEDVLLWHTKAQEVSKQKPYEDIQAKYTLIELLLEGQGSRTTKLPYDH